MRGQLLAGLLLSGAVVQQQHWCSSRWQHALLGGGAVGGPGRCCVEALAACSWLTWVSLTLPRCWQHETLVAACTSAGIGSVAAVHWRHAVGLRRLIVRQCWQLERHTLHAYGTIAAAAVCWRQRVTAAPGRA
jgi:hypothetical protein